MPPPTSHNQRFRRFRWILGPATAEWATTSNPKATPSKYWLRAMAFVTESLTACRRTAYQSPTPTLTPVFFRKSVLTGSESQGYDLAALGKHEGNSGLEDETPAADLCFGMLHAPHCA